MLIYCSFTYVQNQSNLNSQLRCLSARFLYGSAYPVGWMVRLGNYLCGMFPLIYYSPENGFSLVPYIFIRILSSTGFAERRYHQEVSFSLVSLSLVSQNSSWLSSSASRKLIMFWGNLEYLLGEQDEETRALQAKCVSEGEVSPSYWLCSLDVPNQG